MQKKYIVPVVAVIVVVIGVVTYSVLNDYMGNNIEVESVIDQNNGASTSEEKLANNSEVASASVLSEELNGKWNIVNGSKVYWSVTTSKETVNFINEGVTGNWTLDVQNPTAITGEGVVDMNSLDSGNAQRDSHVKERSDLLAVSEHPQATFVAKSFSDFPTDWIAGTVVPLTIEGTIKVKGMEKDVEFESEVMYKDGQLLLSGETIVTFEDFGMQSPHTVVLEAENELIVQLELILNKG